MGARWCCPETRTPGIRRTRAAPTDRTIGGRRAAIDVLRDVQWTFRRGLIDRGMWQRREIRRELLRLIHGCVPRVSESRRAELISHESDARGGECRSCLLYTSDAADERS